MNKRLLSHDAEFGLTQWFIPSSDGTEFTVQTTQDVGGIIELNKKAYASVDERAGWKGDWHRIASIPLHTFFELKKRGITESAPKLKRWLNDPDHKYLRTRPGKV